VSTNASIFQIDSITIPAEQIFANATLNSTYKPGAASITAAANNFPTTTQTITTCGFIASKIAIYCIPTSLPSDGNTYQVIQVQLQDTMGRPALNNGADANVKLFSAQPTIGTISSFVTIPFAKSLATAQISTTYTQGNSTITAQASGYTTGQTTVATNLIDKYTLTASCGSNGAINPNGTILANIGSSQRFNITANKGYHISQLTIDGNLQTPTNTVTINNITAPHTIFADYAINQYTINVTQTPNGTIDTETTTINYGDTPTFTITPNQGYIITNITANGTTVPVTSNSGQQYQFPPITANTSLSAKFTAKTYQIQVIQTANGTISPSTATVEYNGNQTFSIKPQTGYHITDVLVNGASVGPVNSYTIQNVQKQMSITAVFTIDPPTPSATSTPTPSPSPSPTPASIELQKNDNTNITLQINGNITNQQITNMNLTNNPSTNSTTISFTVAGAKGNIGFANLTIPKNTINYGSIPSILIDGQPVEDQGYAQDSESYYVWFTTHFSSHQVEIIFSDPNSPVSSKALMSQTTLYIIVAASAIIATVSAVMFLLRNKLDLRAKFERIKATIYER
jgi:hypothetical protein